MKKIILLITLLTGAIFAADTLVFYVDTPEMVDMYFLIFSAIGRIFKSGEYLDLLRMTFLLGGFMVFAGGIFTSMNVGGGEGAIGGYLKYIVIGVSLLTLLFWDGGTDILIKSKKMPDLCDPTASQTAGVALPSAGSGMPTILAYSFYFTNRVGTSLTNLAVDSYSTVYGSELQGMNQNGGYMGALKGAMQLMAIDPRKISLRSDNSVPAFDYGRVYKSLFTDCILVPYSAKGAQGEQKIAELKASPNISQYLKTLFDGAGVDVGGTNSRDYSLTYGGEVYTCGTFYDNVVKPMDTNYKNILPCAEPIGYGAVGLVTGAVSAADVPSNFNEVAIQAGLVSQLEDSSADLGVGVSGVSYATGKTRAEFIQSSLASGSYMADMLPYLQMTIRAILYAFFPFVFVIVLLPGGLKVLGNYFQSLLWIELWTPTAAILDLFMSSQASKDLNSIYSTQGYTMMSSIDMLSAGSTIAGVAGYLYLSVPALTWLILKGSAQMMQGITSATAAGMASNIKSETINRDAETVSKQQEMNARSGQDLSIAESQHYDAVQSGRKSGAESGYNMKVGLDTVTDMQVSKQAGDIEEYKALKSVTGQGGEQQGKSLGDARAIQSAVKLETGNKSVGANGTLNSTAKGSIESDVNKNTGEMKGKSDIINEGGHTQEQFSDTVKTQNAKQLGSNKALKAYAGENSLSDQNKKADSDARAEVRKNVNSDTVTKNSMKGANYIAKEQGKQELRATEVTKSKNKHLESTGMNAKRQGISEGKSVHSTANKQKAEERLGRDAGIMKNASQSERNKFEQSQAYLKATALTVDKNGDVNKTSFTGKYDKNGNPIISEQETQTHQTYRQKDFVRGEIANLGVQAMNALENEKIENEELAKTSEKLSSYANKVAKEDISQEKKDEKILAEHKRLDKEMKSNIEKRQSKVDNNTEENRQKIMHTFDNLKEADMMGKSVSKTSVAMVVAAKVNQAYNNGESTENVAKNVGGVVKGLVSSTVTDVREQISGDSDKKDESVEKPTNT